MVAFPSSTSLIDPLPKNAAHPERASEAYGLTKGELAAHLAEYNPVERLAPLAAAKIPLFHIHGDVDEVVPLHANSDLVAQRYRESQHKFRLYLDGDKKQEITFQGRPRMMKPGQTMRIGNSSTTEFMDGLIDEVLIWGRSLSDEQLRRVATNPQQQ